MPIQRVREKYLNWEPIKHSVIQDNFLAERIHEKGYSIEQLIDENQISALLKLYEREHQLNVDGGGMFYSLYSKDLDYRRRIHEEIADILAPSLNRFLKDFDNVINSFVIKMAGEKSEFYLHQDTTGLDEFKYSPLSLWIPLQDVNESNGCLAVVEKTHWFFSPFRGVSFSFPFREISDTVRRFLKPIPLKAGQALFFDNRIIHNSLENQSQSDRLAIVCGVFPKGASFQNCYQDSSTENQPIEVFEHSPDYLMKNLSFFYDCTSRPTSGRMVKKIEQTFAPMSEAEFLELCELNGIQEVGQIQRTESTTVNCNMIAEPNGINRFDEPKKKSFLKRVFSR